MNDFFTAGIILTVLFTSQALLATLSHAASESPSIVSVNDIADNYGPETRYAIWRKGKRIGTHTLRFEKAEGRLIVSVESNIKVTILKIPVFRFRYSATETWKNNYLVSVNATTTENGDSTTVTFDASSSDKGIHYATNHWHPGVLKEQQVFNTITGNASQIVVEKLDTAKVKSDSSVFNSEHYRYSGDIAADVWYDEQQMWKQLRFKGDDGSLITYIRQ